MAVGPKYKLNPSLKSRSLMQ